MKARAVKIIGMNILVGLGLLVVLEAAGQAIAMIRPSYEVLFLQPDEVVGWKQVPNLRWTWANADFRVDVDTNPLGFRDLKREFFKPRGVTRVAILGDSFIEAVQVPLAKTATQILEQRLDKSLNRGAERPQRWEVLNFGISAYGVGQYLLTWEQYASKYHPDYVAIFVAKFHMKRTIDKYERGAFPATAHQRLWVRPTFRIENNSLIREPAEDFQKFVNIQEDLIRTRFAGKRMRPKYGLLTMYYARLMRSALERFVRRFGTTEAQDTTPPRVDPEADNELFAVNLKIIEELGRKVHASGGRLIVMDASQYFGDDERVSRMLTHLCTEDGFGYVPLYEELIRSEANGALTHWAHDGHFNNTGNLILANALYGWFAKSVQVSGSQ